jgi:serine/threonine protein kinase
MIGQLLAGRYRVLQVLGAGGFGQTYITEDLHLPGQPKCVLKHLKPATDNSEVLAIARKLFQKEAETLQELGNHDRIPRLLAYFEERQEFYLVQEFIPGHTLSYELLSGQTWSAAAVQRLLREILEILQFVHGQGVIHRDVKPDNIMRRDHDGKLVLIDFGAIKQVRNQQLSGMGTAQQTVAIGTPGYMAPEQARGNPRPNSDIYALGVIGIQALTGQNPSEIPEDDATGELQWQQYTNADRNLVALLTKMTRYHFRDRQPNAAVALQELRALESSQSAQLPTAPLPLTTNPVLGTAATLVVTPAAPKTPPQKPPRLTDPRLDQKTAPKLPGWLLIPAVLLVSATGGYFVIPKMIGNSSNQFESGLQTDRCRVAAPTRDSVTKVRELPDRAAAIKGTLAKGEQLLYVDRREPFIQIEQRNGAKGWVFNDQIDGCNGVSLKPTPAPLPTVSNQPSAVRPKPSVSTPAASSPSPSKTPEDSESESPSSLPTVSVTVSPSSPTVSPTSVAPSPSESTISAPPLPPSPTAETSSSSEPSTSPSP